MAVEYRSARRLLWFSLLSGCYSLFVLAILDGFTRFQVWMLALLLLVWIPPLLAAIAARIDDEGRIQIRYLLWRRIVPVSSVRSIVLTGGLSRSVRVRFSRGRPLTMKDCASSVQFAIAVVRLNPGVDVSGYEEAFQLDQ